MTVDKDALGLDRVAPNRLPSRSVLGSNIRRLKIESGRSWKAIAADTGVEVRHLYNWAGGLFAPNLENLIHLADALGVSLDELVRDSAASDERQHDAKP